MKEGDRVVLKRNSKVFSDRRIPIGAVGIVISLYQELALTRARESAYFSDHLDVDFGCYGVLWGELAEEFEISLVNA